MGLQTNHLQAHISYMKILKEVKQPITPYVIVQRGYS